MATATFEPRAAHIEKTCEKPGGEYELLLSLLKRALVGDSGVLELPGAIDWGRLLDLASRHEVVLLLNAGLRNATGVPEPVRWWFESYCRGAIAHNLALDSELTGLLTRFKNEGIQVVPFKGPVWAKLLYGSVACRQMTDLDLFISLPDLPKASRIAAERGYVRSEADAQPPKGAKDVTYVHTQTKIRLELHWSACEAWRDRRLSDLQLWKVEDTVRMDEQAALPRPEEMFFLLAIHGFRHNWESLKWLCDIAAFLMVFPDADWERLLRRAACVSRMRLVLLPLALVSRVFGIELPKRVSRAIADNPSVVRIAGRIEKLYPLQFAPGWWQAAPQRIHFEWLQVQIRDGAFERIWMHVRFLTRLLKPNRNDFSYFDRKLPQPVYWFARPYRLLRRYGLRKFRQFARQLILRSGPSDTALSE